MKKLIPGIFILLILICSCNAKKSFLTQRYTHLKHNKSTTVAENRSHTNRGTKAAVAAPEVTLVNPATEPAKSVKPVKLEYTKSVISKVIVPVVSKGKEKIARLTTSNSKVPQTQVTKQMKPLNIDQNHQKRGLLWGVIDGILAIIVLAVFVALVIWLLLVLT